jgi:hypothetical protein
LARHHEPGRIDAAIAQQRAIPLERHFALIVDLEALLEFVRNPDLERLKKARRGYSLNEQALLKRIAAIERVAGTTDKLLSKIALLESDGVMLTGGQKFILVPPFSKIPKDMMLSADGIGLDAVVAPPNWRLARTAIDAMSADPAARRWIHQWYTATTAYLFYDHVLAVIPDHVAGWQRVCLTMARPGSMKAACSKCSRGAACNTRCSTRAGRVATSHSRPVTRICVTHDAGLSKRWNATRATSKPSPPGSREIGVWGENQAAVKEFVAVLPAVGSDRELLYLGQLFLGAAQEMSGDYAGARTAYAEASSLYPRALSPRISRLGLDPPSAGGEDVLADLLRQERIRADDPWLRITSVPAASARASRPRSGLSQGRWGAMRTR